MATSKYITYNQDLLGPPFGFYNNSQVLCWWNSIIQAALSLPALSVTILALEDTNQFANNSFGRKYAELVRLAKSPPSNMPLMALETLRAFSEQVKKMGLTIDTSAQEGASNGLIVFIQAFNHVIVDNLFKHKYLRIIVCPTCDKELSSTEDISFMINYHKVTNEAKMAPHEAFVKYLWAHLSPLCDYKCPNCQNEITHRLEQLKMLREIIVLSFSQSGQWFPNEFTITKKNGGKFKYQVMATIEHIGGQSGGHYWANVARQPLSPTEGSVSYLINDIVVKQAQIVPTNLTHLVFYHLMEDSDHQ
jgi:ubiquitin C-terminal hydrolase